MVEIIGARGNIKKIEEFIKDVTIFSEKNGIITQVFDSVMVYDKIHLISSTEHAIRSIKNFTNTTNSVEKEILLYSSGEKQIKLAIQKMGIKKNTKKFAFIFLPTKIESYKKFEKLIYNFIEQNKLERDDKVLQGDLNTLKNHGITEKEIFSVNKNNWFGLILEKVAMVDIIK